MREQGKQESGDAPLMRCFAARRRLTKDAAATLETNAEAPYLTEVVTEASRVSRGRLIAPDEAEEFVRHACQTLARLEGKEILRRAVHFTITVNDETAENSFICLYAALESTLTFFRHEGDYKILAREDFLRLERELRRWLKNHELLAHESAKRGLIYEKIKELNRFPFSYVFKKFCEQYGISLDDLWPVPGRPEEWPLAEIRHRLIHGDPFESCPAEALVCAREHLRWTVERMLLSVLGWPVSQSAVSPARLAQTEEMHRNWQAARAKFS